MMDQSTQVDFPIVVKKIMQRHNTSGDLYVTANRAGHSNSLTQLRPALLRPKSLNFTDPLSGATSTLTNRTKIIYSNNTSSIINNNSSSSESRLLQLPHHQIGSISSSDFPSSISRERTPPSFSCNSSVASTFKLNHHSNDFFEQQHNASSTSSNERKRHKYNAQQQEENSCNCYRNCCCCCCCDAKPKNTKQELSWRRLHMSRAKLKATATTSELLSGFAMVAMVELQINEPTNVPEWLFVMFAVCTTVLVAVHIFALMISTYILPNIDAIAKLELCEMVAESPHERMRGFIELAWAFSTVLGLFLFLVEVAILCWVKFWDYSFTAATAATIIVIPVLITFVLFAVHFYHSLVVYKCNASVSDMEKLENMKKQLDEVTSPV